LFTVYSVAMVESRIDEIDFQVRVHGGNPDEGNKPVLDRRGKIKEAEARRYIEDPFRDFPYDVDFSHLSSSDVDKMIEQDARLAEEAIRIGKPLTQREKDKLWTPERKAALEGQDILAKRASINKELWSIYQRMKRNGVEPTKEVLLRCVRIGWAAFNLFPTDSEVRRRQDLEIKHGVKSKEPPLNAGSEAVPLWHGQNLFNEGRLKGLLQEFNQACGFKTTVSGLHVTDIFGKPTKGVTE